MLGREIVERLRARLMELQLSPDTPHGDCHWLQLRCEDTLGMHGGDGCRQGLSLRQLKKDVAAFDEEFSGLLDPTLLEALAESEYSKTWGPPERLPRDPDRDEEPEEARPPMNETMTLFRPVGPTELELIRASGFRRFPPRLPEQPIFYPVVQEAYAVKIARDWNVKASGSGYVTRFQVRQEYLARFAAQTAGGQSHTEYWIPAEGLEEFNDNIVGLIDVVAEFR